MDDRRPGVATRTGEGEGSGERTGPSGAARPVGRRYPKPAVLPVRLVNLCLRPESWAEAARYPFWVTLVTLIAALIIGAAATAVGISRSFVQSLVEVGQVYDARYSPMDMSGAGVLSPVGAWKGPVTLFNGAVVVDPTGHTTMDSSAAPQILINSHEMIERMPGTPTMPLTKAPLIKDFVPPAGQVKRIDGAAIQALVAQRRGVLLFTLWAAGFISKLVGETLWATITIFLISPMVSIGAAVGGRRLLIPRRVAHRIAGAVVVPLIVFGGVMQGCGYPLSDAIGLEPALIVWFLAASAMAAWAGVLARRMYMPDKGRARS
ncbi:MAG TPA: hypothetical protein VH253_15845 [Phycisphaerae bacterium]|nr:hypothetical protein [Phycisphaerae bacterium]